MAQKQNTRGRSPIDDRIRDSYRTALWQASHSVQWRDALRILERSGVIAPGALTKIYRQRIPELREAIEDLSKGRTTEGFDKLDKFGAIQEIADDADRLAAIAEKQIEA
jgi:predicted transcriptional regulator